MTEILTGRCLCGTVQFTVAAAPRVHYCHCSMCRRATGSAFAVLAWVAREAIEWTISSALKSYRSSPLARRSFCAQCGSALALDYDGSKEVALHAGCFDEAERLVPAYHYGVEGRLDWVDIAAALPVRETKERW